MPIQGVSEEPARGLPGGAVLGLCWQILSQRVKQRSHTLLVSGNLFARRCIFCFRPRDLRSAGNNPGTEVFEPMAKPFGRYAIIFVIALNDAARFVGESR